MNLEKEWERYKERWSKTFWFYSTFLMESVRFG